ncbi:hypothetical protein GCM10025865_33060 [Paraoerskovia sediminicola]|uniref:Uncharacterized protein n=1 Tax=Paraoerskovia sediminicola TaxID=1138587 RepID=A0ABM8G772_9CELL|nr:hypothetical protein [Paraoerskovia sediminicola]BDZ40738.1 hypothetical protein GCM10025865_00370 [Paraoerskovia sediminicola]BDZ44007.1 hypothetical protein GCM10025865_33060 [Paraoerskovia sediminicola]
MGLLVRLTAEGVSQPCVPTGDEPVAAPAVVGELAYGESKSAGTFECVSDETGMGCQDTESGAGFNVRRAGITTF